MTLDVTVTGVELRELVPQVLGVLVRRGADFATAEDAVQESLLRSVAAWADGGVPVAPAAWLTTVALAGVPRHDALGRGAP